ncbi:MAG: CoA-binding protein [Betaproteobacteria bacterium]|nr:CoA-binding protein [Betaproteobacteria bacterium]NCX88058.1 CoA-binding protein [Betaproteobacteria bacterium]NDA87278.1 CoA-binding protein [Betaproteobacteria bacterium]NDB39832.1 CoA-binding protein [Betaproteobacteria bacterium]NDC96829.1 CoA-binding protein [Betaproteobacteria bacterium]
MTSKIIANPSPEARRASLLSAFHPRSVVMFGASDNPNKIGGRPLKFFRQCGFSGLVTPIHAQRPEIQGYQTAASIEAVAQPPDLAIVALPGELAIDSVRSCAKAGVRNTIVMSSGFGETDAAGKAMQQRMLEAASEAGMRIIGPNTQGMANFSNGMVASFSTMFIEASPMDGPVAIVSQSGAMSVVPYGLLRQRGIGVRYAIATGNDADVTVCEMAAAVAHDPALKLMLLYLEGIPDPWHLAEAAAVAREQGIYMIALKAGRTPAGQRAASSHTGALANEDRVVDAFLEAHGIWRVNDMLELVAAVEVYLKHWAPKGKRLVAISNSGAACVQAADAASQRGMTMASLAPKTLEGLAAILPKFATITNPIDITAALLSNPNLFGDILPVIASDPASDGFIIGLPVAGEGYDMASMAEDAAELCRSTGKPLAIAAPQASVAAYFRERGLPVFDTEMQAVNALAQLMAHQALIKDLKLRMPDAQAKAEAWRWQAQACKAELGAEPTQAARCLNEADSLALLKASGVSVVPHALVQTVQQALAWFETIRGDKSDMKFVLKGCSSQIQHKSELGLVRLDLQSAQAIEAAYEDMLRQAAKVSVQLDGVLIAQQVKARREVMIGARYDPVFGTVILAGDGGLYLEAMPDSVVLLAPFDEQAIRAKLRTLRIAPLLDGVRGEPALDVAAWVQQIQCVAAMMATQLSLTQQGKAKAHLLSIDLNPLMLGAVGEPCMAVDALIWTSDWPCSDSRLSGSEP